MPELERRIEDSEIDRKFLDFIWENWPDHETARFLDLRIRKLESQSRRNFIEAGIIALEVSDRCLWRHMFEPETGECFNSFDDWVQSSASVSRSSIYESMRVLKALPDLSVESMKEIPRTNLRTLVGLSGGVRKNPEVIAAASTESEAGFKKKIQEDYPDQHVESNYRIAFFAPKSVVKLTEDVCAHLIKTGACASREEALEAIVTDYCNTNSIWKELE